MWSEFKHKADYGPVAYKGNKEKGKKGIAHPDVPKPFSSIGQIDGSFGALKNISNLEMDGEKISWAYGGSAGYKEFQYYNEEDRDLNRFYKESIEIKKNEKLRELSSMNNYFVFKN